MIPGSGCGCPGHIRVAFGKPEPGEFSGGGRQAQAGAAGAGGRGVSDREALAGWGPAMMQLQGLPVVYNLCVRRSVQRIQRVSSVTSRSVCLRRWWCTLMQPTLGFDRTVLPLDPFLASHRLISAERCEGRREEGACVTLSAALGQGTKAMDFAVSRAAHLAWTTGYAETGIPVHGEGN